MAASTTKEDQAEVEKQQLELTDIEFAVLRDRQVTLRELQADLTVVTGQPVSHSLISRRLSEKGLNARRPRKNPLCVLTRESLRAIDVNVLEWPSRSPYATPIEHL